MSLAQSNPQPFSTPERDVQTAAPGFFSVRDKILIIRLFRLGHIPPAKYGAEYLVDQGLPVLVCEFGYRHEAHKFVSGKVNRIRLDATWVSWLPRPLPPVAIFLSAFFKLAWRFLKEGRPAILFTQGLQEQCLGWMLKLIFRVPLVCQVHEAYERREIDRTNRVFLRLERWALRSSEFLLFPEVNREEIYRERYNLTRPSFLVYNCPPRRTRPSIRRDLRRELNLPKKSVLVGYFGGIGPTNALEEAIVGIVEVPEAHLLFWGWGNEKYLESLKKLASDHGVFDRLHLLGEVGENKWEAIEACDIAYCVYRTHLLRLRHGATASNKFMEAMAAGVPVITNSSDDFKRLVEKNRVGVCVKHINSSEIATALRVLCRDENLRRQLGENGRRLHLNAFHFEMHFEPVAAALKSLMPY